MKVPLDTAEASGRLHLRMGKKYGRLLLSVPIQKIVGQKTTTWLGWLYFGIGALWLLSAVLDRARATAWVVRIGLAALSMAAGVGWLWRSSRLCFYEQGVLKPRSTDKQAPFVEWREIDRYYWEGNTVFLAAGQYLADGFQIRPDRRAEVESLLAARLKAAPAAS